MINSANKWKEFNLNEIFDLIEPTKGDTTRNLVSGFEIPYIAAMQKNNGYQYFVSKEGNENYISKGNCIVFIHIGQGSGGYSLYQPCDFIGMKGKTSCGYSKYINKYNALFLVTMLNQGRYKFCFGRNWDGTRFKGTKIKLPTKNNNIDWDFMSDYILNLTKTIKFNALNNKKENSKLKLNYEKLNLYRITDLFDIKGFGSISSTDIESKGVGDYPYITRTERNNGITGFYEYKTAPKNVLTIETTLSGLCFYHDYEFSTGDHIMVLTPKEGVRLNKYTALFIKTIWRKNSYKYDYNRPAIKENIVKTSLILPTKDNKPDWDYMEEYIKNIPYGDLI